MARGIAVVAAACALALGGAAMIACQSSAPAETECACVLAGPPTDPGCDEGNCCLCMLGCREDAECPSVMRCGFAQDARYVTGAQQYDSGNLLSCECGEAQSPNGTWAACVPASGASELALVNGFGVQEMALTRVADTSPPLFAWAAPTGARTVSCALFGCEPRFSVHEDSAGQPVVEIANFDACVLAQEEFTALSAGFDPTKAMRGDADLAAERALLAAGEHVLLTRGTLPLTTLSVGCWAYDGDALVASTRLTPVPFADLAAYEDVVNLDCQGETSGSSCATPGPGGVSLGSCYGGACLSRCTSWEHCPVSDPLSSTAVRCQKAVLHGSPLPRGLWGVLGVCEPCEAKPEPEPSFVRVEDADVASGPLCEETGKSLDDMKEPWDLHCKLASGKGAGLAEDGALPSAIRMVHSASWISTVDALEAKGLLEDIETDVLFLLESRRNCAPDDGDRARMLAEALGWDWVFAVERVEPSSSCEIGLAILSRYPLGTPRRTVHNVGSKTKGILRTPVDLTEAEPPYAGRRIFLTAEIRMLAGEITLGVESLEPAATAAEQQDQARELAYRVLWEPRVVATGRFFQVTPALGNECFAFPRESAEVLPRVAVRGVRVTPVTPPDPRLLVFDVEAP